MSHYQAIKLLDTFIARADTIHPDDLIRQRVIVAVSHACLICLLLINIWFYVIGISEALFTLNLSLASLALISFVAILLVLKLGLKYAINISSSIMTVSTSLILLIGIYFTGGPANSPVISLLALPPIMGFFLIGSSSGWAWTISIIASLVFMTGLSFNQHEYPDLLADQKGALQVFIFCFTLLILASLAYVFETLFKAQLSARSKQKQKFQHLALHDPLTNLANRELFNQTLLQALNRANREKTSVALLMIDLDHFKPLNDMHGHHVGDELLKHVADKLKNTIRASDLAARLGGDEFAVILEHISQQDVATVADKILQAIASRISFKHAERVHISCIIGVAISRHNSNPEEQAEHLYLQADKALYKAKQSRNTWCFLNDDELSSLMLGQARLKEHLS